MSVCVGIEFADCVPMKRNWPFPHWTNVQRHTSVFMIVVWKPTHRAIALWFQILTNAHHVPWQPANRLEHHTPRWWHGPPAKSGNWFTLIDRKIDVGTNELIAVSIYSARILLVWNRTEFVRSLVSSCPAEIWLHEWAALATGKALRKPFMHSFMHFRTAVFLFK